jgi:hypothetical protein
MKTLNHIIIYNLVFSLVKNCCICNPYYMTSSVEMGTTSSDGTLLNALQVSSKLPHPAYIDRTS